MSWELYYEKIGSEPRELFLNAFEFCKNFPASDCYALDLGCGAGNATIPLINAGWQVHAVDITPTAFDYIYPAINSKLHKYLLSEIKSFEEIIFDKYNFVHAGFSLPFCPTSHFENVLTNAINSLKPNGIFAANFFGKNDTWKSLALLDKYQLLPYFQEFEMLFFEEREYDKPSVTEQMKHWHVYDIICRKK